MNPSLREAINNSVFKIVDLWKNHVICSTSKWKCKKHVLFCGQKVLEIQSSSCVEHLEAPIYASIYSRDYRLNDEEIPSVETLDIEKGRDTFEMYKGIVREDKILFITLYVKCLIQDIRLYNIDDFLPSICTKAN